MGEERKDNSGAAWVREGPASTGECRFRGEDFNIAIFRSGAKSDAAPPNHLAIWPKDRNSTTPAAVVALFRAKEGSKAVLNGKHDDHWVNVFANESTNGNAYLGITFMPMDEGAAPSRPATTAGSLI